MFTRTLKSHWLIAAATTAITLAASGAAFADHHGGGGVSHSAVGRASFSAGHISGNRVAAFRGQAGFGGYRHYAGGYRGFRGGYYPYGHYGFRNALFFGAFVSTLPLFYDTYWWGGVPYYYGDGNYYLWNRGVSRYEVVAPPEGLESQASAAPSAGTSGQLFAYPKNGQSTEDQARDKYDCHRWAADQTGFDPTQPNSQGANAPAPTTNHGDYRRAEIACLEGRGYSVK